MTMVTMATSLLTTTTVTTYYDDDDGVVNEDDGDSDDDYGEAISSRQRCKHAGLFAWFL